ncbi:LysR family transcriptional regulator [Streptomyces sp. NPDC060194]|uniref:LysR family transcriptional regulator n=1 Tax=Streptomyces sp. NPDC060194 TaxID=3347069 RepID=UPI003665BF3B
MERQEMDTFLTLAEELHFGRTAELLHVSRAHATQTLQKLERRVGAALFERTSRRVALTPIGKRLRDDLAPLRAGIDAALDRAVDAGRGFDGRLSVGFTTPWSGDLLIRVSETFRRRHPGIQVDFCEAPSASPYGSLRDGTYDLQLTELPVSETDFTTGPALITQPRALVLPARHPLARRASLSLEDLADVTLLAPEGDLPDHHLDLHVPTATPSGRPVRRERAFAAWQEALALVAAGRGAVVGAALGAEYHVRPGIAYVPLSDAPPIEYGLAWRRTGATARVAEFVRIAGEVASVTA